MRSIKVTASPPVLQVHSTESQYRDYKRSGDSFWSKLEAVKVDTAKLEHLFETKSKEISVTKVMSLSLNGICFGFFLIICPNDPLYQWFLLIEHRVEKLRLTNILRLLLTNKRKCLHLL